MRLSGLLEREWSGAVLGLFSAWGSVALNDACSGVSAQQAPAALGAMQSRAGGLLLAAATAPVPAPDNLGAHLQNLHSVLNSS